jgi:hypothetical protein
MHGLLVTFSSFDFTLSLLIALYHFARLRPAAVSAQADRRARLRSAHGERDDNWENSTEQLHTRFVGNIFFV